METGEGGAHRAAGAKVADGAGPPIVDDRATPSLQAFVEEAAAKLRALAGAAIPAEVGELSDRLDAIAGEALGRASRTSDPTPPLLDLAGRARFAQRSLALAAIGSGDLVGAERAALRYLGLAPPMRASGDMEKPLPADRRYRRVLAEPLAARVRALTGGTRTAPPPCCAATTRLAAADPAGFAAIALPRARAVGDADAWLLSPLDVTRGFVPCAYGCAAAIAARRASLASRDLASLRAALSVRLLQLAPGVDLLVAGPPGKTEGAIKLEALYGIFAATTPPALARLVESLVVRRLLAGPQVRFLDEAVDARQGLVFVKMLHRSTARWLDLG